METQIMKRTQKIVLALITAIGIGAMASSYATGMDMGPGGGCAMAGKKMGNPALIDSHLAKMKKDLKIGSEQEEAWSAFADNMKQQRTEMMSAMQDKMQQRAAKVQPAQAAPDRIGERIRFMKQRVAGMETAAAALKQLYGVLTPQQKEILDARFGREMLM
jgi:Spy/CpxP family protein refolding chaperone